MRLLRSLAARFARAEDGVSAVEFALIAPLMILIYFGVTELCQGYMVQRRVNHAAAAVADLVAQKQQVTAAELDDVFLVGELTVAPFSDDSLRLRVSSVVADAQGVGKVAWSRGDGYTPRVVGTTVQTPAGLLAPGGSVLMAEVQYEYAASSQIVMDGLTRFQHSYYLAPRLSQQVTLK